MSKRKKIIIANWKMNPADQKEAKKIFLGIKKVASRLLNVQTVVCPPFIHLEEIVPMYKGHRIAIGAQDAFQENQGSFTGMISPEMLKANGVTYVILGHSERRALGETDDVVNNKIKTSLKSGLNVILCVGEKERDDQGWYFSFVKDQIVNSLEGVTKNSLKNISIAYEPVWAISNNSKNKSMSSESIYEMYIFIKKVLSDKYGVKVNIPDILYGGSANKKNTEDILVNGHVDGLLVGRASLDSQEFGEMLIIANSVQLIA